MAVRTKLPITLKIRNKHEHPPFNELIITPTVHTYWTKPNHYTYECYLSKTVFFFIPTKMEPVTIYEMIVAANRTTSNISYGTVGMRFGNVFASSSSPYGSVQFDKDLIFVLTDGRVIETNTREKRDVELLLPILQQQAERASWTEGRRLADLKAQRLKKPVSLRTPQPTNPTPQPQPPTLPEQRPPQQPQPIPVQYIPNSEIINDSDVDEKSIYDSYSISDYYISECIPSAVIYHKQFGEGKIADVIGNILEIKFDSGETKKLDINACIKLGNLSLVSKANNREKSDFNKRKGAVVKMNKNNTDNVTELWQRIITEISKSPKEIQTIDKYGRTVDGKWFYVYVANGFLYVDEAKLNRPSSNLRKERVISKPEFLSLYPNYHKWRAGTMPREIAKCKSMNSSYIFALINEYSDKK